MYLRILFTYFFFFFFLPCLFPESGSIWWGWTLWMWLNSISNKAVEKNVKGALEKCVVFISLLGLFPKYLNNNLLCCFWHRQLIIHINILLFFSSLYYLVHVCPNEIFGMWFSIDVLVSVVGYLLVIFCSHLACSVLLWQMVADFNSGQFTVIQTNNTLSKYMTEEQI